MESIDRNTTQFLEYFINYDKKLRRFEMSVMNENDLWLAKTFNFNFISRIVNYPEIDLITDKIQTIGIIIGIIKKINRNSNSKKLKKIAILSILNELKIKKYLKNWIKNAIWKVNAWNSDKVIWLEAYKIVF
jgi:hypothetical protein